MSSKERTVIAVKPDGVQRGLVSKIIARFEDRGYKLVALKMNRPTKEEFEAHYQHLKDKPYFNKIIEYMLSGPVVAMIIEGADAVKTGQVICGETDPLKAAPGTIRGDYALYINRNVCHASGSVESAKSEMKNWFEPHEIFDYDSTFKSWLYE
ncbi:Nucleoside diphosphate kinase [Aphelenchoides besseyi]|nr:Nucleoside diphosphate kinase [Aphelenchoides besseyi]KAI6209947.1 Nucleoside diphosphate kinase [Aphelenchoides besseyi]